MNKKHNFGAGPSVLPDIVIEKSIEALRNFKNTGVPLASMSHRSDEWLECMQETQNLWKEILNIPNEFYVLLLQGGGSMQFMQVPYNLLNKKAAYLDTGLWASNAIKEAKIIGEVDVVASGADYGYTHIPDYTIPSDADYFHITTNNTVFGTEIHQDIKSPIPLVADMSSDILTRKIDFNKYSLIYGGAQKNAGIAGATFVIVRKKALGKVDRKIPYFLDYKELIKYESSFNTPPVVPIYFMNETLKWLKSIGGVEAIQKINKQKADVIYWALDNSKIFKCRVTDPKDRSIMNVLFVMQNGFEDKLEEFIAFAQARDIVGIRGHRYTGGLRASLYNALTLESAQLLATTIEDFEKKIL